MLQLTRRVGQGVDIGGQFRMYVRQLATGSATVQIFASASGYDVKLPITYEKPHTVHVYEHPCEIRLLKVDRGEARFEFKTSPQVAINRMERLA